MIKPNCQEKSAYLITDRKTCNYLIGYDLEEGYLLVGKKVCAFIDARYYSMVKPELEKLGVETKLYKDLTDIKDYLEKEGIEKICLDYDKTTLTEFEQYKKLGVELLDGSLELKKTRSIKTNVELEYIKRACEIAQNAYHTAIKQVKVGISELHLKNLIEKLMLENGAEQTSFETIVAFGKNSAVPHHKSGNTVLEENSVILVDMGCKVNGYCSDLTRTAFFGNPSEKFTSAYQSVLKANQLAIEKITNGDLTDKADGYAREYLVSVGLGEYFTHSLGHGIGLDIHEYPTLSPKKSETLKNQMVFSIEPGVYFDGEFGIRIEDTVVLQNGKVERLFTDSKQLMLIK